MYKIKQLEWNPGVFNSGVRAEIFDKKYTVTEMQGLWTITLRQNNDVVISNVAGTLEAAKEIAQKDFEYRVRQHLDEIIS